MIFAKKDNWGHWETREVGDGQQPEAQTKIYEALGWIRVAESGKPEDGAYHFWSDSYRDDGAGGCEQYWWRSNRIIRLDRDKLLAAVQAAGLLDSALAVFTMDADAQNWWANSMNYVEGSPMAEKVKAAFSLSDEQIHALVEASRA